MLETKISKEESIIHKAQHRLEVHLDALRKVDDELDLLGQTLTSHRDARRDLLYQQMQLAQRI